MKKRSVLSACLILSLALAGCQQGTLPTQAGVEVGDGGASSSVQSLTPPETEADVKEGETSLLDRPPKVDEKLIHQELGSFAKLAEYLKPSVVHIIVTKNVTVQDYQSFSFFRRGTPRKFEQQGQGSGVILSSDGYIVTNNHVIAGSSKIKVQLSDGKILKARVMGVDVKTDLALLKAETEDPLPTAKFGDSDSLRVGDWVMAIGNPFGLDATVTVGVLSGKGRTIGASMYDDFLQTDASINPGNSGGPLFNLKGEVVGINTAIIKDGQGIGFAIPVDLARTIIDDLKDDGKVMRGYMGVALQSLNESLIKGLDLPEEMKGALVGGILPDGPADRAGLETGDIITEWNGEAIESERDLLGEVAKTKVGQEVPLKVYRSGQELTLRAKVVARPDEVAAAKVVRPPSPEQDEHDLPIGLRLAELTPSLSRRLQVHADKGVVIVDVIPGSAADRSGLQRGDVILAFGKDKGIDARELVRRLQTFDRDEDIVFLVERQGMSSYITLANS